MHKCSCQALALEAGHTVLDAGSGSGYLTTLAAHLVGEGGASVGVEVSMLSLPFRTLERAGDCHAVQMPICLVHIAPFEMVLVHCGCTAPGINMHLVVLRSWRARLMISCRRQYHGSPS